MIARIAGTLLEVNESILIIDIAGLGYEVEVSATVLKTLPALDAQICVHTHFVVREDAQLLFGFVSKSERDLFRAFIKLNGVGPKLGLALISALEPQVLAAAVHNNDVTALTKVPGVGKKTAERLLLELKSRIDSLTTLGAVPAHVVSVDAAVQTSSVSVANEAEDALIALGHKPQDASRAVALAIQSVAVDDQAALEVEQIVRLALRNFGKMVTGT